MVVATVNRNEIPHLVFHGGKRTGREYLGRVAFFLKRAGRIPDYAFRTAPLGEDDTSDDVSRPHM